MTIFLTPKPPTGTFFGTEAQCPPSTRNEGGRFDWAAAAAAAAAAPQPPPPATETVCETANDTLLQIGVDEEIIRDAASFVSR